jgi:hypothetical protein
LLGIATLAGFTFLSVMYDGSTSDEALIEAVSFATQTVTTVGYGNWEKPAITPVVQMPQYERRVLQMRLWSSVYMLLGATIYAVFTGVVVSLMVPPNR